MAAAAGPVVPAELYGGIEDGGKLGYYYFYYYYTRLTASFPGQPG